MKWWALAGGAGFYVSLLTHAALMLYLLKHDLKHFWLYLPPVAHVGDGIFMQIEEELLPLRNKMGAESGKGFGSHQSDGADLLYALQGPQDQAWLSRDPAGPGVISEEPSRNMSMPGGAFGDAATAGPVGVPAAGRELVAPTVEVPPRLVQLLINAPPEPIGAGAIDDHPRLPATQPAEPVVAIVAAVPESSALANPRRDAGASQSRDGQAGGSERGAPAADAAPESDSESDAFARIGSVRFKNGKLDVRLGRTVKTVRPRFTIKGGLDQMSLVNPVTVVKVTIAETGKVSDVRVIRSSGSNELDLPWVLAVYKWWFEPAKDAAGRPTTDIVQLSLGVIDRAY